MPEQKQNQATLFFVAAALWWLGAAIAAVSAFYFHQHGALAGAATSLCIGSMFFLIGRTARNKARQG